MHCTAQQLADATLCIGLYNEGKGQYSNRDANFFPVVNRCKNALMLHCAPIMLEVELIGRSQQVLQSFRQKANQTMLPDGRILAYWASSEPSQRCANVKLTEYRTSHRLTIKPLLSTTAVRNSFLQAPTESLCLVFRLCLDLPQSQVGHVILARRTFFLQGKTLFAFCSMLKCALLTHIQVYKLHLNCFRRAPRLAVRLQLENCFQRLRSYTNAILAAVGCTNNRSILKPCQHYHLRRGISLPCMATSSRS